VRIESVIFLLLLCANSFIWSGCSSATSETKNKNESAKVDLSNEKSDQKFPKLKWSWTETDGTRTTMSIDALVSGMIEVEYAKLKWDRVSRPSMKLEQSSDYFLEIRYSTDRDSLIAILTRPVQELSNHSNVTRQITKSISEVGEGLQLLQMFAKNDGRFEEDSNWNDK